MKNIDEMIESIEVLKGGHVTRMTVSNGAQTEEFALPFDSTPPSLVVVSREGLVKLLEADYEENAGMRALLDHLDAELRDLRQPNLPLTFDQLKGRVGKPVYRIHKDGKGTWMILLSTKETCSAGATLQTLALAGIYPSVEVIGGGYEYYDKEVEK